MLVPPDHRSRAQGVSRDVAAAASVVADFVGALETCFTARLTPIAVKLTEDDACPPAQPGGTTSDRESGCLLTGPLAEVDFAPDAVVVFCDAHDAMRLMTAAEWMRGVRPRVTVAARDVCIDGIMHALCDETPVIAVPCGAECVFGGGVDDGLLFITPAGHLGDIVAGLEAIQRILRYERTPDLQRR